MTKNIDSSGPVKKSGLSVPGGLYANTEYFEPHTVVTHGSKAHMDDFLSTALMLHRFPTVTRIKRVAAVEPSWLASDQIIVLDIGKNYNPKYYNFDHHQTMSNDVCTFNQLIRHFYPSIENQFAVMYKWYPNLGLMDNVGPKAMLSHLLGSESRAVKVMRVNNLIPNLTTILLNSFSRVSELNDGDMMFVLLREIGQTLVEAPIQKQERMQMMRAESRVMRIKSPNDDTFINVLIFDKEIDNPSFGMKDYVRSLNIFIDATVTHDPRNGGLCYYREQDGLLDFSKVRHPSVIFAHKSGFILTTKDKNLENVNDIIREASW